MKENQAGQFFFNIPHVFARYSSRKDGNMKYAEYKEGEANREFFRDKFLGPDSHLVLARVNHSSKISVVDLHDFEHFETIVEADALIAAKTDNLFLAVTFADCPPVFIVDPVENIFAIAHCGWKPVINDILYNVFNKMLEMGADVKRLHAAIGPGICKKCYEFGEKDAKKYFRLYKDFVYESKKPEKCRLDLMGVIKYQLVEELGINSLQVEISSDCTSCRNDLYFSFRKDKMNPKYIKAGIAVIGHREVL